MFSEKKKEGVVGCSVTVLVGLVSNLITYLKVSKSISESYLISFPHCNEK